MGRNPRLELKPLVEAAFYSTYCSAAITDTNNGRRSTLVKAASRDTFARGRGRRQRISLDGTLSFPAPRNAQVQNFGRRREVEQAHGTQANLCRVRSMLDVSASLHNPYVRRGHFG
jgi:hypothetical protein